MSTRYTRPVFMLLAMLVACDLTPMPQPKTPTPKPPRKAAPDKRVPDAAFTDTGVWEEGSGLIRGITYAPAKPTAFDDVTVQVAIERVPGLDIDYGWSVNDKRLISARGPTLRQVMFNKGDKVQAHITIEKAGKKAHKDGPRVQIGNAPPRILTNPSTLRKLDGFRVRAEDPDGGPIRFRLDAAPPGLTIGENTGVFRYAPSKTVEGGRFEIKVAAIDVDKGESEWRIVVTVSGGSESKEGKAKRAKAKAAWEAKRKAKQKAGQARE